MKVICNHVVCDGKNTYQPDEEADFDTAIANSLIESGAARPVETKAKKTSAKKSASKKADLSDVVAD